MKDLIKHKLTIATYSSTGSEQQDEYLGKKRAADAIYSSNNRLQFFTKRLQEQGVKMSAAIADNDDKSVLNLATWIDLSEKMLAVVQQDFDADQSVFEQLHGEKWQANAPSRARTTHLTQDEIAAYKERYAS
jgi:hypothetical protein